MSYRHTKTTNSRLISFVGFKLLVNSKYFEKKKHFNGSTAAILNFILLFGQKNSVKKISMLQTSNFVSKCMSYTGNMTAFNIQKYATDVKFCIKVHVIHRKIWLLLIYKKLCFFMPIQQLKKIGSDPSFDP